MAACALIATACGDSPASPSPPAGDLLVGLRLEPTAATVKVGTTRQFTLVGLYYDGTSGPVTAQSWVATPNGVATIDGQGNLTALRMGLVTVSAAFEDKRAALVLSVTDENDSGPHTDLSATWTGEARIDTCIRISGPGRDPCGGGGQRLFSLSLTQLGFALTGSLRVGERQGTVQGWRDLSGRIFLVGSLTGPSPEYGTMELTDWQTAVIGPDTMMSGGFQAVERFTNGFGDQVLLTTFRLIEVRR